MLCMRPSPGGRKDMYVCPSIKMLACNGLRVERLTLVLPSTRRGKNLVPIRFSTALNQCHAQIATNDKDHTTSIVTIPAIVDFLEQSARFELKDKRLPRDSKNSKFKPRVIIIAGPTAVGKTGLSIELAKFLGGEIINADSVQVYQGLDIGAAKISIEERKGIPHHLMDVVPPTVDFTYEHFLMQSRLATEDIIKRGRVPIVVGGTGMYIRWYMQNKTHITSHPYEGEHLTGEGIEGLVGETDWDYDFQCYFLYQHRADLYPRVDVRCEQMVPNLLQEASQLLDLGVKPGSSFAAKAIGYEEAIKLLLEARQSKGIIAKQRFLQFLSEFQRSSKKLVRKQIAWFRRSACNEVRKFRWVQAGQPVQQVVDAIGIEYLRPCGKSLILSDGELLMAASLKEQKRLRNYRPSLKIFSDTEAVAQTLDWIKRSQAMQQSV